MSRLERAAALGLATGLAFLAPGCGEKTYDSPGPVKPEKAVNGSRVGKPYPGVLHCEADLPDAWETTETTPPNLDAELYAEVLGASATQIREGRWGAAICDEAIRADQVMSRARIKGLRKGLGSRCLVIAVTTTEPQADKTYKDVVAVCAAPS